MSLKAWLVPATRRVFPFSAPAGAAAPEWDLARNERCSVQVALRHDEERLLPVSVSAEARDGLHVRVRRVGYVPLRHCNLGRGQELDGELGKAIPGFVPDPLFEEDHTELPPRETHAFWVDVRADSKVRAGKAAVRITVKPADGRGAVFSFRIRIHPLTLRPRRGFHVTNWFYNDALIDWYRTDTFDARYWRILPRYIRNLVDHGQDTLYVPVFTPPLDGVKTPSQLLRVKRSGRDNYSFDWSDVRRYVRLARRCGIKRFEWCHLFTQWGAAHPLRVYEGQGEDERLLWSPETGATGPVYRRFLSRFLPELHDFLVAEDIMDRSFFHLSDEPKDEHLPAYRRARRLLAELAPWMKVMDALSEIEFARRGLTDMPIPSIRAVEQFQSAGMDCWCYYCCGPRGDYLQRLLDTPLAKIAMHGMLFHVSGCGGFLHWGANYWYRRQTRELLDPFTVQDGGAWPNWAFGDTFMVYPGPDGPIDSMRWEIFGQALQDMQWLQALGVKPGDPLLREIKSFSEFPGDEGWRRRTRRKLAAILP